MKRLAIVALLVCAACGREETSNTTTAAPPAPMPTSSIPTPQPVAAPRAVSRSTPQKCAGDGSYDQALDCFRMTTGFHFTLDGVRGEMTRPTLGMERVQFKSANTTWIGEAKHQGVVWTRNGAHELSPPEVANQVWQRTTMVLDPQKKEGSPQLSGTETISGEPANHYHFINANTGDENDVWISTRDGRIVKWKVGKSALELR